MKKSIIVFICILLLSSLLSFSALAEEEAYTEISTPEELAAIADNPGGSYILSGNIDMKGIDWTPLSFSGRLDGDGYTIYNLSVTAPGPDSALTYDGNLKEYETCFAGLFSVVRDAEIKNLNLIGVRVNISTDKHCFAAGLAGFAEDTVIINCSVNGRVSLYQTGIMCGVGGIVGFGHGTISGCSSETELVFIDGDTSIKCEEFLGGILACGYTDIENCSIKLRAYASVQGYVHNGGITGMYYVYNRAEKARPGYVRNNSVDAEIYFYEDNRDRRAYCDAYVGERLSSYLTIADNITINYKNGETFDYSKYLLPNMCTDPEYTAAVTAPGCTDFGYTSYTCTGCDYAYRADYTAPAHSPGQWVTTIEPTYTETGMESLYCLVCGALLEERELPVHTVGDWELIKEPTYTEPGLKQKRCSTCGDLLEEEEVPCLIYVSSCSLNASELKLTYKSSAALSAEVLPSEASNKELIWSSSDDKVVTVDKEGNIYASGRGTAVVTLSSADGNASSTCTVTVKYTFWQWLIVIFLFGWIWY